MSFHAHRIQQILSEPCPSETEWLYGSYLVWVYFPVSAGEMISGIWVIRHLGGPASVAVYTTLGRSCIFRSYLRPEWRSGVTVQRLNGSSDGDVISFYYNDLRPQSSERDLRLAIVSKGLGRNDVPENPPWPKSEFPDELRAYGGQWFHSKATLQGVQSVDICRHRTKKYCLGILLHYKNRTREVLGQWRVDQVIETMTEDSVPHLIRFHRGYDMSTPYVREICFKQAADLQGWTTFRMHGHLVWWFNEEGGLIRHEA
ncbi:hypothetical protein BU24DRAFT_484418 [Aaosphaeria arxii CBS 175.79]|uniref:Uncharacterized protein n=1 Tax=Aaosphaeria arxii CBS 175.79 TaxID=1450172 RepID=A0A6A5XIB5_9PLEO|nr:uncharacterized protein BU24DRAFT_484418 [Aaosphaeria arxii CBS 175.79]KAF2012693.1 hypothetical protein BU24DRAFT_484418 [Aaosphaeria arxii CBS 175.79]